jgi:hypothetical protein
VTDPTDPADPADSADLSQHLADLPPRLAVQALREQVIHMWHHGGPKARAYFGDRARADRNVKTIYAGRFVLELLQNACDARDRQADLHREHPARVPAPEPARAALVLTETHLLVANTGVPFSFWRPHPDEPSSIESICSYGASTKGSQRYKGQFGIGIKSVDEVCDQVLIDSGDVRLRFDRARLRTDLGLPHDAEVPLFDAPDWFEDAEAPEGLAELAATHDTVVALRLRPGQRAEVRARLDEVGPRELLLLETLHTLRIEDRTRDQRSVLTLEPKGQRGRLEPWRVTRDGLPHDFVLARAPIDGGPQEHRLVWPVDGDGHVQPLPADSRPLCTFYAISRERCGIPFALHSYFRLDPSRKAFPDDKASRAHNTALSAGAVALLVAVLPDLAAMPRAGRPLHALVWPRAEVHSASSTGASLVQAVRDGLWSARAFEGFDGTLANGTEWRWLAPGSGLDAALTACAVGPAPFCREGDRIQPLPEDAVQLDPGGLGEWLAEHPPQLGGPGDLGPLLVALSQCLPDATARQAFRACAATAAILPVEPASEETTPDGAFDQLGQGDGQRVFYAEGRAITVPATLRGVLHVRLLHAAALGDNPTAVQGLLRDLLDVRPLAARAMLEALVAAVDEGASVDTAAAVALLGLVVRLVPDELAARVKGDQPRMPATWFWADDRWNLKGGWRIRQLTAQLPLPLRARAPVPAQDIVAERVEGELSRLYPADLAVPFLHAGTEHPEARALLDGVLDGAGVSAEGDRWPWRRALYAWLGAWPMPRLHALSRRNRGAPALNSGHPGLPDAVWRRAMRAQTKRQGLDHVRVGRSLGWPELPQIVRWCTDQGRLPELLAVIAKHRTTLLSRERSTQLLIGSKRAPKYGRCIVNWQLQHEPWLPAVLGAPATAAQAWWTRTRLDARHLQRSRWRHLPFLHAGACDRDLAERLRIPLLEEPTTPDRDTSLARNLAAMNALHATVEATPTLGDDKGLRLLYTQLSSRLADLGPAPKELAPLTGVLAVKGGGAAHVTPRADVVVDDLPMPLPLGADRLPLALLGPRTRRLADAMGLRRLSHMHLRYHAADEHEAPPEETTLTDLLQWLLPYAIALRAFGRDVEPHIELASTDSRGLIERGRSALVELVHGVQLLGEDDQVLGEQDARRPVIVAHAPAADGHTRVYVRKSHAASVGYDTQRLFRDLAAPVAQLAGDPRLAAQLELLILRVGDCNDVQAAAYLRERAGVDADALAEAREACGLTGDSAAVARAAAARQVLRAAWRDRARALRQPLLGVLLVAGTQASLRAIEVELDAVVDQPDPLEQARDAVAQRWGLPALHDVWAIATASEAEAYLVAHPALRAALDAAVSAIEVTEQRARDAEHQLLRARTALLAWARLQTSDRPLVELLAAWEEVSARLDRQDPDLMSLATRALLHWIGADAQADAVCALPDGTWWSGAHLAALGLDAAQLAEFSAEIAAHDALETRSIRRREHAYAAWIRGKDLHKTVVPQPFVLPPGVPDITPPPDPADAPPSSLGPLRRLQLRGRDDASTHHRRHRRQTLTGGLGEVFVLLLELERWAALEPADATRMLDAVVDAYEPDTRIDDHAALVRAGPPGSEPWTEALSALLRIGDRVGARCDLLGLVVVDGVLQLGYLEVKSSRQARPKEVFLSAAEWAFLRDPRVRHRAVLVVVSGAVKGRVPSVALLPEPARLVDDRRLALEPDNFVLRLPALLRP